MKYRHVFGPVPSRRLGSSLGVDLTPRKQCSFDCVYCECGKTTVLTGTREEFFRPDVILEEIRHSLANNPKPDFITFSGNGEPTLYSGIGEIICGIRQITDVKIALLTNSSLMADKQLRNDISGAHVVVPTFNAVSQDVFEKINRPSPGILIKDITEGLIKFRKDYSGDIWLEIFIIEGINDTDNELKGIAAAVRRIKPDKVQLNSLDRPGTESWVKPVEYSRMLQISQYFYPYKIEIAARKTKPKLSHARLSGIENVIADTLLRRPCTTADLSVICGVAPAEIEHALQALQRKNIVSISCAGCSSFWTLKQ